MGNQTKSIAVVLAGAVARGAFEAGVIQALANTDVRIVRIVAASAGALNGVVLASSVRGRSMRAGAEALRVLWRDNATWSEVFHVSFRDIFARKGMSDQRQLLALLRRHVPPSRPEDPADIHLRIVVAALNGVAGTIGGDTATTFESTCDFDGQAFASREGLERVFAAATASAALPVVFAPVGIDGLGPCIDGGTVNNTPMKWALGGDDGADVDAVVVVATSVAVRSGSAGPPGGLGIVDQLADMLIDERLYRDLREAAQVNDALARLDGLVQQGVLSSDQRDRVLDAFRWTGRRSVQIVQIRPTAELRGSAFSGFFDANLRSEQLEAGFRRGQEVLRACGWLA
ncbi:MAG TPA: patatin-like phospholipase family protein [Kofleriaceae bacterium]|nr:patatin-like phospholipase family protein [Kofleriaceae bacterium]